MERDKLKEKIRKLLSLSLSPNEHEAKRALEKAQELCAKYNMDMTEAEKADSGIVAVQYENKKGKALSPELKMAVCCADFFGCEGMVKRCSGGQFGTNSQELFVVGSQTNVEIVFEMLDFTLDVFNKLFMEFWDGYRGRCKTTKASCRADYRAGFFSGVYRALKTNQERNALVIVKSPEIENWKVENKVRERRGAGVQVKNHGNPLATTVGYTDGYSSYKRREIRG